jgi:hypothetical protein
MITALPSVAEVRAKLEVLSHASMQRLAKLSGVPFTTIWKIRDGTTRNPGIETVGQFLPHLAAAEEAPDTVPAPLSVVRSSVDAKAA